MKAMERLWKALVGVRFSREAAERAFWEVLGKPQISKGMAERMREEGWVGIWHPERGEMTVHLQGNSFPFPLEPKADLPPFSVSFWNEGAEIEDVRFSARPGRFFFRGEDGAWTERALALVRGLRPFFEALGLGDLEEALEALKKGGKGFQKRGAYLLVWGEGPEEPSFLFRGKLFGDPFLDANFLSGREVVLRFPEVEVVLRGGGGEDTFVHLGNSLKISGLGFRWRDRVFPERELLPVHLVDCHVLDPNPIPLLLRKAALRVLIEEGSERAMSKVDPSYPRRIGPLPSIVRGVLEEIKVSVDPLAALSRRGLLRRAALRGLASM